MTTFGLLHGAWHGPWCFDRLIPELERFGHTCLAPDIPVDRPLGWEAFGEAAVAGLRDAPEDLVVVGHSLGAGVAPMVAAARPVTLLISLCGVTPPLAYPPSSIPEPPMDDPGTYDGTLDNGDGTTSWVDREAAIERMYADCDRDAAEWAVSNLRPNASPWDTPYPLERHPDVPLASIACTEDRLIRADWVRWAARERLGIEPIDFPASHSPFLSRPAELARLLDEIAGDVRR